MYKGKTIVISSGHGDKVRGAHGIIDERDEAVRITDRLAQVLKERGVKVITFHDRTSTSQSQNLWTITDFHNLQKRELDISVHLNAYEQTASPRGAEVLYITQSDLAKQLSAAIASVGFIDRGAKYNNDLHFLNQTVMPSVLLEICFVDSQADCDIYAKQFENICLALGNQLAGEDIEKPKQFVVEGKCSFFGGPEDMGVSPSEGLAFIYDIADAPQLFLSYQPVGTTGLARRLNVEQPYVACRWPYQSGEGGNKAQWREILLKEMALVSSPKTGKSLKCFPSDWGPHEDTGRVCDLSPSALEYLGLQTDDSVRVEFPITHRYTS